MNTISIVIPSYNHAEYIEACLDSIYFQDYPSIEIIIVDDCSTDSSPEVISNWIKQTGAEEVSFCSNFNQTTGTLKRTTHKRYNKSGRSIVFEPGVTNLGSTQNYNRGFRLATGEYCTFICSDDIAHPQMLSSLARPLERDEADFVYADMFIIDDQHRILREFKLPEYNFRSAFCDWYLCGVATLYRRFLHDQFGYYDETSDADDHECYLRFAMNGVRFLHLSKTLYSVRSHDTRQVGLHAPDSFDKLLEESKRLVLKARKWADINQPD